MKAKPAWTRLITEARVINALDRFDLAFILWAVKTESRTRVLAALLDRPATTQEIRRRTGISESTAYRALKELRGAHLVVSRKKVQGRAGPGARLWEIASGRNEKIGALPVS